VQLDRARRLDVAVDLALDDDRAAADLGRDLRTLADVQRVVGRDLAGEGAVDPHLAFERELPLELGPAAQQGVQIAAGCIRLTLLHVLFRLRFLDAGWHRRVCLLVLWHLP